MTDKDLYTLGDDLPKVNPWQDDRLGYAPFAKRLARVIRALRVPNGYVVGLHGEWGSGKSTALNFVHEYLKKHNVEAENEKDRICLIDFRPWIISGHQDLVAAFFKVLSESIGTRPRPVSRVVNRIVRIGKVTADPLLDAMATVALVIDPSGGTASKAVTSVAKKSVGGMIDRFLTEPSLQKAHENLKNELANSGKRFLVTIDDLDRLQDDEIRSIMQMVKTVGRLPNVIYLLAYDRDIVWSALDGEEVKRGPKFAEKIVQQEVELPRPSKDSLLSILDKEIAFLNQYVSESIRWHYIVRDGVRRWVRHPRDALRLANAVKFSWPALQGEIDPADLLAMEGLRLFDPIAFYWMRWNRDFLFTEGHFVMSSDEIKQAAVKELRDGLPDGTRDQVLRVLAVLFPSHAKVFEGKKAAIGEEPRAATAARRGVGYPAGYDAYFGLHPSSDAIPKAVIDGIIGKLGNEDALLKAIEPYLVKADRQGQPAIGQLLEELRFRFYGREHAEPTQESLNVLFEIGERVLAADWRVEAFALSPRAQLSFLISDMLEIWGQERAGQHLIAAFKRSNSPAFCADIFVDRARELGKIPGQSRGMPTVTEDDLQSLGEELLKKIEGAAANGTLSEAPFYFDIVRAWSYMDKTNEAKAWLTTGMLESAQFLAKVTLGLVAYSLSNRERLYSVRDRPDETLYDIHVICDASKKHLASNDLNQDQRNRIAAVLEAAERMLVLPPPQPA